MSNIFTKDNTTESKNFYNMPEGVIEHEGFTITISYEPDYDADTSYIGEFSNTPKEGAIKHSEGNGTYKYFNPANGREYAKQEYDLMMRIENNDLGFHGVIVTVTKKAIELGSASLWGVDTDNKYNDYLEIINDLAYQALEEAKSNLKELCK